MSGAESRTGRVTRGRAGEMCLRWGCLGHPALETERNFRKIIGHEDLWMLKAVLDEGRLLSEKSQNPIDEGRLAAQGTHESPPNLTLRAGHNQTWRSASGDIRPSP